MVSTITPRCIFILSLTLMVSIALAPATLLLVRGGGEWERMALRAGGGLVIGAGQEKVYEGSFFSMNGNITVLSGGSLLIRDAVLNYSNAPHGSSTIKAMEGSTIVIENSTLQGQGLLAVVVETNDSKLVHSILEDFYLGLFLVNCTASLESMNFRAITFDEVSVSHSTVSVTDCVLSDSLSNGLYASKGSDVLIDRCVFDGLALSGVYALEADSLSVENSTFDSNTTGIYVVDSPLRMVSCNVDAAQGVFQTMTSSAIFPLDMHSSTFTDCSFHGDRLGPGVSLLDITHIVMEGCSFSEQSVGLSCSMELPGGLIMADMEMSECTFYNDTTGIDLSSVSGSMRNVTIVNSSYFGLSLDGVSCRIDNISVSECGIGMADVGSGATITGSSFTHDLVGISLEASSSTLTSNEIAYNTEGIEVYMYTMSSIRDNRIFGNREWGIRIHNWEFEASDNDFGSGSASYPFNGLGRVVTLVHVGINVLDAFSQPVGLAGVLISSPDMGSDIRLNTSASSEPMNVDLMRSSVAVDGSMILYTYDVLVEGWGASTRYVLTPVGPTTLNLTLRLPNIRIDRSSVALHGNLSEAGGSYTVIMDVHNDGDVSFENVQVQVTMSGAVQGIVNIPAVEAMSCVRVEVPCESGGVPESIEMNDTVELEISLHPSGPQEYNLRSDRYLSDNSVIVGVSVSPSKDDGSAGFAHREIIVMFFSGLGLIEILVVFVFTRILLGRKPKVVRFTVKDGSDEDAHAPGEKSAHAPGKPRRGKHKGA